MTVRWPIGLFCVVMLGACAKQPCRDEAPAVQLDVVVDDVDRATAIHTLQVTLEVDGVTRSKMFDVGEELLDGRTSIAVDLDDPAPSSDFMLVVQVAAWSGTSDQPVLVTESRTEHPSSADGCNLVELDLTGTPAGGLDAGGLDALPGVDAGEDAGLVDAGQDAGVLDTGPPDMGFPEICGDGLVVGQELCDDGNETLGDGCSDCRIDQGYGCAGSPSRCELWWDETYSQRVRLVVETSTAYPLRGYQGYTLRATGLNTAQWIEAGQMAPDCRDLRVVYVDGASTDLAPLPRHIVACGTSNTEVRFKGTVDMDVESINDHYFVYFGGPDAPDSEGLSPTNVYLWYDDASSDRGGRYVHGRMDDWFDAWDDSLRWSSSGYYVYDSPNDYVSSYRRNVDERDVYVEAEFYHTACASQNMASGLIVRGLVQGSTGTETAWHYYYSGRSDQEGCDAEYETDGDITRGSRSNIAVDVQNPPRLVSNQWRRHALAAWGEGTVQLKNWDADASWSTLGWPEVRYLGYGEHSESPANQPGSIGIITMQDSGRTRNLLARRYVEPEPRVDLAPVETLAR